MDEEDKSDHNIKRNNQITKLKKDQIEEEDSDDAEDDEEEDED